jgi:hypothetical protein
MGVDVRFRFSNLLYRYVFFDWLFVDVGEARNRSERDVVWQHNRTMRRYLPVYLGRWSALSAATFLLGYAFEQYLQTRLVAACFFTGCAMTMSGMAVIVALWLLLRRSEAP